MKNNSVVLLGLFVVLAAGCSQRVDLEAEKSSVKTIVDQFVTVIEKEDMPMFDAMMAHDSDMVNFGTDAAERWVGWSPLKSSVDAQFAAFEDTKLTVRDQVIKVHSAGQVAWFSEVSDWTVTTGGKRVNIPGARLTGVLEKRNGKWMFVQFHASVPVSDQSAQY